jgi:hypothetical protein
LELNSQQQHNNTTTYNLTLRQKTIMRTLTLLIVMMFGCLTGAYAQGRTDSIKMKKVMGGYQFFQHHKPLKMGQLVKTLAPNEAAYAYAKSAQANNTWATVIGGAGGFMIGWTLGTALGGGEPNWTLAGIGAGLVGVSIPFTIKANRQAKKAVDTFNGSVGSHSFIDRTVMDLRVGGNGIGLMFSF